MLKVLLVTTAMLGAGGLLMGANAAYADEVIIHRDGPDVAPPSSSTTVEKHTDNDGCSSKTVHKENDAGDTKTVHSSNCD